MERKIDDLNVLITIERLLNSSPDFVYQWLQERTSENPKGLIEWALIKKNNRLLDLAVAQYAFDDKALAHLFSKALMNDDHVLKLACLSNQKIEINSRYFFCWFPRLLFNNDDNKLKDWFSKISMEEVCELFKNPATYSRFLNGFLAGDDFWKSVNDDIRVNAIEALRKNPKVQKDYYIDDWVGDSFNSSVAWKLSEWVPTSTHYAYVLKRLYRVIRPYSNFDKFNAFEVSKRWFNQEEETNKNDYLENLYALLRYEIYKPLFINEAQYKKNLANEDIAYRWASYSLLELEEKDIEFAYKKDKELALEYLIENEHIWASENLRRLLKNYIEISYKEQQDPFNRRLLDQFYTQKEKFIKKYPSWFNIDYSGYEPLTSNSFKKLSEPMNTKLSNNIQLLQLELSQVKSLVEATIFMLVIVIVLLVFL